MAYLNIWAIYFLPEFILELSVFCKQHWITLSLIYHTIDLKIFMKRNEQSMWFQDIDRAHQMSRSFYSAIEQGQRFGMWVFCNWCNSFAIGVQQENCRWFIFRSHFWGLHLFMECLISANPRLFFSLFDDGFKALGVDDQN